MPVSASTAPHPGFRLGVSILLRNDAGQVLIGERTGPLAGRWQMPQGGIDPGETPHEAAMRELLEEVGTDRATMLAESRYWYAYELPPALIPAFWGGRWRGQTQKWFAFAFTGSDADIDVGSDQGGEFSAWRWAAPAEVLRLIVDFKRPVYEAVLNEFRPFLRASAP